MGSVSVGCHLFGGVEGRVGMAARGSFRNEFVHAGSSQSDADVSGSLLERGVGGALRLNSFGTVIFVDRCTVPDILSECRALWQLMLFCFMSLRSSCFFSSICISSISWLLKCFLEAVLRESCEIRDDALACEYTLAAAKQGSLSSMSEMPVRPSGVIGREWHGVGDPTRCGEEVSLRFVAEDGRRQGWCEYCGVSASRLQAALGVRAVRGTRGFAAGVPFFSSPALALRTSLR